MDELKYLAPDWGRIRDSECETICQVPEGQDWDGEQWRANRDRLAACWNACISMPDPAAAIQAAREALEFYRDAYDATTGDPEINLILDSGDTARRALSLLTPTEATK